MLNFQLETHEKYLKNFILLFKKLDTDTDGILNEDQFRKLIAMIPSIPKETDPNRFLEAVDPFNNNKITFSDCCSLLTTETINEEAKDETGNVIQKTVSILQKLATKDEQ